MRTGENDKAMPAVALRTLRGIVELRPEDGDGGWSLEKVRARYEELDRYFSNEEMWSGQRGAFEGDLMDPGVFDTLHALGNDLDRAEAELKKLRATKTFSEKEVLEAAHNYGQAALLAGLRLMAIAVILQWPRSTGRRVSEAQWALLRAVHEKSPTAPIPKVHKIAEACWKAALGAEAARAEAATMAKKAPGPRAEKAAKAAEAKTAKAVKAAKAATGTEQLVNTRGRDFLSPNTVKRLWNTRVLNGAGT